MQKKEKSYVAHRAELLAVIHLTRHDDVVVSTPKIDPRVDLEVHLTRKSLQRTFGVITKGTGELLETQERATEILNAMKQTKAKNMLFPICILLFSAQNDAGYYAWKVEPVIDDDRARLVSHTTFHCKKLDTEAMVAIIDSVDEWYEALMKSLVK